MNKLSVGQIYLHDNPLLTQTLKLAHTKPRLHGHWRTTPELNFIYQSTRIAGMLCDPTASDRIRPQ